LPFAPLEQLAAGIPTIAYNVPGPRQIFKQESAEFLVAAGDVKTMSDRAIRILRMNESEYEVLSIKARDIASQFRWEEIAEENIRAYKAALAQIASN
jgi:glycosyltransferase involved in cell wall biosynthesis